MPSPRSAGEPCRPLSPLAAQLRTHPPPSTLPLPPPPSTHTHILTLTLTLPPSTLTPTPGAASRPVPFSRRLWQTLDRLLAWTLTANAAATARVWAASAESTAHPALVREKGRGGSH